MHERDHNPVGGRLRSAGTGTQPSQLRLQRGIFRRQLVDGLPEPCNHTLGRLGFGVRHGAKDAVLFFR